MRLKILTPVRTVIDADVWKVELKTTSGAWTILERHADGVFEIVPGLLIYTDRDQKLGSVAIGAGFATKANETLRIVVEQAYSGDALETLSELVSQYRQDAIEQELKYNATFSQLEFGLIRSMTKLERGHV
ncbi:MAG: hypothetical protein QNI84_12410 [Henriciella sp.]|nr:hypothetical protein [Henriciella sp.]